MMVPRRSASEPPRYAELDRDRDLVEAIVLFSDAGSTHVGTIEEDVVYENALGVRHDLEAIVALSNEIFRRIGDVDVDDEQQRGLVYRAIELRVGATYMRVLSPEWSARTGGLIEPLDSLWDRMEAMSPPELLSLVRHVAEHRSSPLLHPGLGYLRPGEDEDLLSGDADAIGSWAVSRLVRSDVATDLRRADILRELGRHEEALAGYRALQTDASSDVDEAVRQRIAWTTYDMACVLRDKGLSERSSVAFGEVIAGAGGLPRAESPARPYRWDPDLATLASLGKAEALAGAGSPDGALSTYDVVIMGTDGYSMTPGVREACWSRWAKARLLIQLGRDAEALPLLDTIAAPRESNACELRTWALLEQGGALERTGRAGEAIYVYEKVERQQKPVMDDDDPTVPPIAAKHALARLGELREARKG